MTITTARALALVALILALLSLFVTGSPVPLLVIAVILLAIIHLL